MSKKEYKKLEEHIIDVFRNDRLFSYNGKLCEVLKVGKPRPHGQSGECKTDVFVRAKEQISGITHDIKISVKNLNKEFMGNKLKKEDVENYLGPDWEDILIKATTSLKNKFEHRALLYASEHRRIKANSVTVGWKLEITDKQRELSVPIPLSDQKIRDFVYKGTNLAPEKRDSEVNNEVIAGSGVAEYLITTSIDDIKTADDVIEQMKPIDDVEIGNTYFVFTANNYRTDEESADGPRYLAVRIEWETNHGRLIPRYCYNDPLKYTGERDMAPLVRRALESIGKSNVDELKPGVDVDEDIYEE